MKYKCLKSFNIPKVDEDWNHTDESFVVEKNSIWHLEKRNYLRVASSEGVSLVNEYGEWIEIYSEKLKGYFEVLEDEE